MSTVGRSRLERTSADACVSNVCPITYEDISTMRHSNRRAAACLFAAAAAVCASASAAETRSTMAMQPASVSAQPVPISPTIQLSQGEFERLQAIASRGIDELRRFLWRTRMIYGYRLEDVTGQAPRRA